MKKNLLPFLFFIVVSTTSFSQYGGNSLGLGAVDYVEIPDNPNGQLDINNGFTFEAWIFNYASTANQKIGGKIASDFKNGFIFGIEDSKINMEVFDQNGLNTKYKAGHISDIGWTHVAGTYQVGGMLKIFVNGEKVGETAASSAVHGFNNNPFRIGIAPWDVNALGYAGYIDEISYWTTPIDEAIIRNWMHRNITSDHPNYANLSFYLKCDETTGPDLSDSSGNNNYGTFSTTGGQSLDAFFLPFAGDFDLFGNDVQGVWNAKPTGVSDIMTIEAQFFDSLELEQSAVFANSDGDYTLVYAGPSPYTAILSKKWRVTTQGSFFINFSFDLNPTNISNIADVALLYSEDEDFSDAGILPGVYDWDNHRFNVTDETFTDGYYYTLGFQFGDAAIEIKNNDDIKLSPNPSNGLFTLDFEKPFGEINASISNLQGQAIYQTKLPANQLHQRLDVKNILTPGVYCLKIWSENENFSTHKIIVLN